LKDVKVNFIILPGQHNYQVWTSMNRSDQFRRLQWGTDANLQHV
jgi:hypothetical protein